MNTATTQQAWLRLLICIVLLAVQWFLMNMRLNNLTDHQVRQLDALAAIGATKEEVIAAVGKPHQGSDDFWVYWTWAHTDPMKVAFSSDGKVVDVSF